MTAASVQEAAGSSPAEASNVLFSVAYSSITSGTSADHEFERKLGREEYDGLARPLPPRALDRARPYPAQ